MTDAMSAPRTPAIAWQYRDLADIAPDFAKLRDGVIAYYASAGAWFDDDVFTGNFDLMTSLE